MKRRQFLSYSAAALGAAVLQPGDRPVATRQRQAPFSRFDGDARALLARMSLADKIGQMVQAEFTSLQDSADIATFALGSLLAGGNADPASGNSLQAWTDTYDAMQRRALDSPLGIPLVFGVDAVHGHNNVTGAVVFPHNIGLGCTRDPALVQRAAALTAEEVRATGINWSFAPCLAVVRDDRWGRTYEGFGESPDLARTLGAAAVRGLQGSDLSQPLSVLACAKHFAGDGGTSFGTAAPRNGRRLLDQGDTQLTEAELWDLHVSGYLGALDAGVGTVMPSYNSWNGEKASGSTRLLTDLLDGRMGFDGFLISDYNAIDQLPGDYKAQIAQSVTAGMDMFMAPSRYRELHGLLLALAREGGVPMARIDDAVVRILRVKIAMGLLDRSRSHLADRRLHASFGSEAHRAVARECVRRSQVLLKNAGALLPLAKNSRRIHVAGKNADDIGNQCGGWTIDWQGTSGPVTSGGTTILAAIRATVSPATQVTASADGSGATGADVGIVVIGETPYAEFEGDRVDLTLAPEDLQAVRTVAQAGVPVVAVLVSGRPLAIEDVLAQSRAVLAAWLPGTEGQGVADVLFGDIIPTGTLSVSWPRSPGSKPVNVGDAAYDPLFTYGFGLTYGM